MKPFHKRVKSKILREINLSKGIKPRYADQFVTVFSHPRSGTHFTEAFLAKNFYRDRMDEFQSKNIGWGHWANSKINPDSNPYWKLFGSHYFPSERLKKIDYPIIYIIRDGRAVAYSIWKTENFIHPKHKRISFSDFLRLKLDWKGSPGRKSKPTHNLAQHWENHVTGWCKLASKNDNILVIHYEKLVDEPYEIYQKIHNKFFRHQPLLKVDEIDAIKHAVGLKPNQAKKDSWQDVFTKEDLIFFKRQLNDPGILSFN